MKQRLRVSFLCFIIMVNCSSLLHANKLSKSNVNTSSRFGTTHFIIGYDKPIISTFAPKNTDLSVAEKPYVINGSSAHLIDPSRQTQSFFTTIHDITSIILKLIDQAERNITIAVFALTDSRIAKALYAAHQRNVDVCIIMDKRKMKERYSKAQDLINKGMCVWCYEPSLRPDYKKKEWADPLMHHKCMVIDDIVLTGSANSTKAAQVDNIENINILRDPLAVEEHRQEFVRLKKFCVQCPKKNSSKKRV